MTKRPGAGWRFFTAIALGVLAAVIVLELAGIDRSAASTHGITAIVFLALGGWALSRTRQGKPLHTLIGGLLLLAASIMSFIATFLPEDAPTQLAWSLALAGALSAIALELVMARMADDLEALRGGAQDP